jgi:hypothetical protein
MEKAGATGERKARESFPRLLRFAVPCKRKGLENFRINIRAIFPDVRCPFPVSASMTNTVENP